MGQAVAPKTWWISSSPMLEFLPFKIMTLFERFVDVCCKYAVLRGIHHFHLPVYSRVAFSVHCAIQVWRQWSGHPTKVGGRLKGF